MIKKSKKIIFFIIILSIILLTVVRARYSINRNQTITIISADSNVEVTIDKTKGEINTSSETDIFTVTIKNNNNYDITYTIVPSADTMTVTGGVENAKLMANSTENIEIEVKAKSGYIYANVSESLNLKVDITGPYKLATNNVDLVVDTFTYKIGEIVQEKDEPVEDTYVDFSSNITEISSSGLYETEDESGKTQYFRGVVDNNYISFAGKLWRIVRINGDGSYRIALDSLTGKSSFNTTVSTTYNNVGFMYSAVSTNNYNPKTNTNKSAIMTYLENWYTQEGLDDYEEYIDKDAIFWNDRTTASSDDTQIVYSGWNRILKKTPTLNPADVVTSGMPTADMFSVTTTKGNGKLSKPIGLLTADEIMLAGGTLGGTADGGYGTYYDNRLYYLYTSDMDIYGFWTMTPRRFYIGNPTNSHMIVSKPQAVVYSEPSGTGSRGVKPVINLKSTVKVKGSGTKTDPYVVKSVE